MAGRASPGVTLSPNLNVTAPAGFGGDKWGANGGGITPVGVSKPLAATLSDGETANNFQPLPVQGQGQAGINGYNAIGVTVSSGVFDRNYPDSNITNPGTNQG